MAGNLLAGVIVENLLIVSAVIVCAILAILSFHPKAMVMGVAIGLPCMLVSIILMIFDVNFDKHLWGKFLALGSLWFIWTIFAIVLRAIFGGSH